MPANRLDSLKGRKGLLAVFLTAGYPSERDTVPLCEVIVASGADVIEIGMPFSDPVADGPTIQEANTQALRNGMTLPKVLDQVRLVRHTVNVPIVLMGALNPVLQYGFEAFAKDASQAGVDGLILPDLPLEEIEGSYGGFLAAAGMGIICLVTPQTSPERIRRLDAASKGFLYAVTQSATTGGSAAFDGQMRSYFGRLKSMNLSNPVLAGFGIGTRGQFLEACEVAEGAVVGSAFLRSISMGPGSPELRAASFIKELSGR